MTKPYSNPLTPLSGDLMVYQDKLYVYERGDWFLLEEAANWVFDIGQYD